MNRKNKNKKYGVYENPYPVLLMSPTCLLVWWEKMYCTLRFFRGAWDTKTGRIKYMCGVYLCFEILTRVFKTKTAKDGPMEWSVWKKLLSAHMFGFLVGGKRTHLALLQSTISSRHILWGAWNKKQNWTRRRNWVCKKLFLPLLMLASLFGVGESTSLFASFEVFGTKTVTRHVRSLSMVLACLLGEDAFNSTAHISSGG